MEPDGFIHIVSPDGKETTYYHKDYEAHSGYDSPTGLIIWFESGRTFIPWVQILTMHIEYNSKEYLESAGHGTPTNTSRGDVASHQRVVGGRITGSGKGHLEEVPRDPSDV